MPYAEQGSKGKEWAFETTEILAWWAEFKFAGKDRRSAPARQSAKDNPFADPGEMQESEEDAKARKERALADRHELTVARAARLLVPIDEIRAIHTEENVRVRTHILSIPEKIRPMVAAHMKNDKKATEQIVGVVEGVILKAMEEIRGDVKIVEEFEEEDDDLTDYEDED